MSISTRYNIRSLLFENSNRDGLSLEISYNIFSYLNIQQLGNCQRISQTWLKNIQDFTKILPKMIFKPNSSWPKMGMRNWSLPTSIENMTLKRINYLINTTSFTHSLFINSGISSAYSIDTNELEISKKKIQALWSFDTGTSILFSPIIDQKGILYFISSSGNKLYALDTKNTKTTDPKPILMYDNENIAITSSLAIDQKGILYFGADDNKMYAFDTKHSKPLWTYLTSKKSSEVIQASTIDQNGILYATSFDMVYAFDTNNIDAKNLEPLWTYYTSDYITALPTIDKNDILYIGDGDCSLTAIDTKAIDYQKPTSSWSYYSGDCEHSYHAIDQNGILYFGTGEPDCKLVAFNTKNINTEEPDDQEALWVYESEWEPFTSPALDQNGILYASSDKTLYAFDTKNIDTDDPTPLWTYDMGEAITSCPIIDQNDTLYLGSEDNTLYAFDTKNIDAKKPKPLWTFETGGAISSSPVIDQNGILYVGSQDGKVYAIDTIFKRNRLQKKSRKTDNQIKQITSHKRESEQKIKDLPNQKKQKKNRSFK